MFNTYLSLPDEIKLLAQVQSKLDAHIKHLTEPKRKAAPAKRKAKQPAHDDDATESESENIPVCYRADMNLERKLMCLCAVLHLQAAGWRAGHDHVRPMRRVVFC